MSETEQNKPPPPPPMEEIEDKKTKVVYKFFRYIKKGGYSHVFVFKDKTQMGANSPEFAVKFEEKDRCKHGEPYEWDVYRALKDRITWLPKLICTGSCESHYYMVMEKLESLPKEIDIESFAKQAIKMLEDLHKEGYVHGDVKPENFCYRKSKEEIVLVDFGLASRWKNSSTGEHVEYDQRPQTFRGTCIFASEHALVGRKASRRDDLVSLAYTLFNLYKFDLPWQNEEKHFEICTMQMEKDHVLKEFEGFIDYAVKLKFDEKPNFRKILSLVQNISPNPVVKQQGPHPQEEGQDLWISVYDAQAARKQRYHYNVETWMLERYFEKREEENLYISSVAFCKPDKKKGKIYSWALIMDESKHPPEQECKLVSGPFMDGDKAFKALVEGQWKRNYYITALAGADDDDGPCLMVTTGGLHNYGKQTYVKGEDSFPYKGIHDKWKEGFFITAIATVGSKWIVVMTQTTKFSEQVVEYDLRCPTEGIETRMCKGFTITAVAATKHQIAIVMSVVRKKPTQQMILSTTTFPNQQIKDNWLKTLYVTSICYGQVFPPHFRTEEIFPEATEAKY